MIGQEILRFLSLQDANVRFVLFGSFLLGATGGLLGSFVVLRKRSLLGDALAHAALPGVVIAFLITGSKSIIPLLIGASISGILGMLAIQAITNASRIKPDAALGLALSVFFGIGIVLLTHVQRQPLGNQSGLDKFLFGQAASLVQSDLLVMGIISLLLLIIVILFYKEFRLLCFDADFLAAQGFNSQLIDLLLMALIVLAVMVGLQAVGGVLMAAMLITPAIAARFWTNHLTRMIVLASIFGGISGILGTFFSSLATRIPTGPVMVLAATFFMIISALFAPKRGVLAKSLRYLNNQRNAAKQHVLRGFIEISEQGQPIEQVDLKQLAKFLEMPAAKLGRIASQLVRQRLAEKHNGSLTLTTKGRQAALQIVKTHRLWEHYLVYRAQLEPDHVHRDADEMEHILSPDVLERLEELLKREGIDTEQVVNIHGEE
jgi:manganese/zinc/iron transport system permease protein